MHGMKKKKLNGILHMNSLSVIWLLYGVLCVWVTTVYSTSSLITVLHETLQNILNSTDIVSKTTSIKTSEHMFKEPIKLDVSTLP